MTNHYIWIPPRTLGLTSPNYSRDLETKNFKIQLNKSKFLKKGVAYLGHLVTSEGVNPKPDKITAIRKYPIPKTTKEIKGLLGLLGHYRKLI